MSQIETKKTNNMETKKSNVNTSSQQTGKKKHSSAALGAGMGIASIAGATIGSAFTRNDKTEVGPEEDVLVDVVPEEENPEEVQQQEQPVEEPVNDHTLTDDQSKDLEKEEPQNDDLEKEPDDVVDNILNEDNIDDPDFGNEIHPVEMRYIVDADGNEVEAMIFADEFGNELALCQGDPGSGVFDKLVDPYTLEELPLPLELSYTRSDFEEILHDDGGYMPPEPEDSIFADNDDITKDIKTTDEGEMVAQNEAVNQQEPDVDVNMDDDELDEPEINESDEELIAQMLTDEDDEPEVNEDLIDIIEDWLDDDVDDDVVIDDDNLDEEVLDEDDLDEEVLEEDDLYEDDLEEDDLDEDDIDDADEV